MEANLTLPKYNVAILAETAMIIHDYTLLSSKYLPEDYVYTTAIDYSDSMILSGAPKHIFTISLTAYFSCDLYVVIGMLISLAAVSLITAIDSKRHRLRISRPRGNKVDRGVSTRHFVRRTFTKTAWVMSVTLVQKHMPNVPNLIPTRMVTATWLASVMAITTITNCLFRTKMSFPIYLQVDQLGDVSLKPNARVNIIKNSPDFMRLAHKAIIDENTRSFLEQVEKEGGLIEESDSYNWNLFKEIHNDEKMLLTDTRHFTRVKYAILGNDNEKLNTYLSQGHLKSTAVFYLIRRSLPPTLIDGINVGLMSVFERKPFHDVVQKYRYQFNRHAWVRPTDDNLSMAMSNFYGAFSMMAIGIFLSILIWILELIVFLTFANRAFQLVVAKRSFDFYFKP